MSRAELVLVIGTFDAPEQAVALSVWSGEVAGLMAKMPDGARLELRAVGVTVDDIANDIIGTCSGVPEMLRSLAAERRPGPVVDLVLKQADRVEALLERMVTL